MLIAGRVLNGVSVGIESAQVPVYVSELAPPQAREEGWWVANRWRSMSVSWSCSSKFSCQSTASSINLTDSGSISYGGAHIGGQTSSNYSTLQFRVPWAVQLVPALYLLIGTFFLPESPRWLAKQDRWEEAHDILTRVHGKGDPNSQLVLLGLDQIKAACQAEAQFGDVTYWELFKPKMLNRTIIGAFDQIWCQLTGMNLMSTSGLGSHCCCQWY